MKRTILIGILCMILISAAYADVYDNYGEIGTAYDDLSNRLSSDKFPDAAGDLGVLYDDAAKYTTEELKVKIDAIYQQYGLKPSTFKLNSTIVWIALAIILAGLMYLLIKKGTAAGIIGRVREMSILNKIAVLIPKFKRNKENLIGVFRKIKSNYDKARANFETAQQLYKDVREGRLANVKEKSTAEQYKKQLEDYLGSLDGWLKDADGILKSTIQISELGKIDMKEVEEYLAHKERALKEHDTRFYSADINERIEKLKKEMKNEADVLSNEQKQLLYLITIGNELNFGLGEYKKVSVHAQIDHIQSEQRSIKGLLKAIKKNNNDAIKERVKEIFNAATEILDSLKWEVPLYNKLFDAIDSVVKGLESANAIDLERRRFEKDIREIEPRALVQRIVAAKEAKDEKEFYDLMRELLRSTGSERMMRIELRTSGVNEKITEKWVDEFNAIGRKKAQ